MIWIRRNPIAEERGMEAEVLHMKSKKQEPQDDRQIQHGGGQKITAPKSAPQRDRQLLPSLHGTLAVPGDAHVFAVPDDARTLGDG